MTAIGAASEGSSFRCRLCGFNQQQPGSSGPSIACPACGRPVADVSSSLERLPVPRATLQLLPASVARECRVVVFAEGPRELVTAADLLRLSLPILLDQMDKLRFVLNGEIRLVHATQAAIDFAIDRDYRSGSDDDPAGDSTLCEL